MIGIAAVITGLALAGGGVDGSAWRWATVVLAVVAGAAMLSRRHLWVPSRMLVPAAAVVGLAGWSLLSITWASSSSLAVSSTEQAVLYAMLAVTLCVTMTGASVVTLVDGLILGAVIVDLVALWTKLFEPQPGHSVATSVNRLQTPFDYWNALGIFAALGVLLAIGRVVEGPPTRLRVAVAGSIPLGFLVVYFTFSRGAILSLFIGLLIVLVGPRDRVRRCAQASGLAVPVAVLLLVASLEHQLARHPPASTHPWRLRHWLARSASEGHELAFLACIAVAGCLWITSVWPEVRAWVHARPPVRKLVIVGASVIALVVAGGLAVRMGSPQHVISGGLGSLEAPPPKAHKDLNNRLASVSLNGRSRFWDAAWSDFLSHPLIGSGAGSFAVYWLAHRTVDVTVTDAHSVVLQTGAELGVVGLALLLLLFSSVLRSAVRAWREPLAPALVAALVAYLLHTVTDRDWEIPAVACFGLCLMGAVAYLASAGQEVHVVQQIRHGAAFGRRRPDRSDVVAGEAVAGPGR